MATSLGNAGIPLEQDYIALNIDDRDILGSLIQLYPQYNQVNTLITTCAGTPFNESKWVVEQYIMDNDTPYAEVLSAPSLTFGNKKATIVLTDPTFDKFRVNEIVRDNVTSTHAKVIAHYPGQLEVIFQSNGLNSSATAFTSSDFAAGHFVTYVGPLSEISKSAPMENIYYKPSGPDEYAIEFYTDSLILNYNDMYNTTRLNSKLKNSSGKEYLQFVQEQKFIQRIGTTHERKLLLGQNVIGDRQTGRGNEAPGLLWQIINKGGMYTPLTSMPTEDNYKSIIEHSIDEVGTSTSELLVICGSRAWGQFQTTITDKYLIYAGTNNTFGGTAVDGLNVQEYSYLGVKLRWLNYDMFNNPNQFPEISQLTGMNGATQAKGNMLILNTSNVMTADNGEVPFVTRHTFGDGMLSEFYNYVPGALNRDGSKADNPTNLAMGGTLNFACANLYKLSNPRAHGFLQVTQ